MGACLKQENTLALFAQQTFPKVTGGCGYTTGGSSPRDHKTSAGQVVSAVFFVTPLEVLKNL